MQTLEKNSLPIAEPGKVLSLPNIVKLPDIIRKNSYTYILYRRGKRNVIYEQKLTEFRSSYEVFTIRTSRDRILPDGRIAIAKEVFPHNETFRRTAWSCATLERALVRFNELEGIANEQ